MIWPDNYSNYKKGEEPGFEKEKCDKCGQKYHFSQILIRGSFICKSCFEKERHDS